MTEEVTIIGRKDITTFPKLGKAKIQVVVTYSTADIPPTAIFIDKEEYTKEKEAQLIKQDIARKRKAKVETIKV